MNTNRTLKSVFAVTMLGLFAVGRLVAAAPAPPQAEPTNRDSSPVAAIPLKCGSPIPLAIESPGAEWRGQPVHLVKLTSIQFDLDKPTGRLKADIKADVRTFDNVVYDVSVAVFDAGGKLLGASRGRCDVQRIMLGKSTIRPQTIGLDFGVSLDYERAASFMVAISNRKVVTPEQWYKQKDAVVLTPRPIVFEAKPLDEGWQKWDGLADPAGTPIYAECLTSLSADADGNVWVGTSRGKVYSIDKDRQWTLQADLKTVEITSIAVDGPDVIWLATNDGIRRLSRNKDAWRLREYRQYYEGEPGGVSGGYIPPADGVRLWGYVDRISFPPKDHAYAPLAVSVEHGLFCYAGYHGVWHHFMPHYWGPSSDWLDLREVIPHRRPTRIVEDSDANLWVGTQWDGFVRFNARARGYHNRNTDDNKRDGTEFTSFGPKEVGCAFDRVVDLKTGREQGLWAVLGLGQHQNIVARFDGKAWTTLALPLKSRKATCIAEIADNVALVGTDGEYDEPSVFKVDWKSRKVEEALGVEDVFEIIALPDGRVFAASWGGLYERSHR